MIRRVLVPIRAVLFAAVALATAVVPAAMAVPGHMNMSVHQEAGHASHEHPAPDQPGHARTCCDLCVVSCGSAVTPIAGAVWHLRPLLPAVVSAAPPVTGYSAVPLPHRQPLAHAPPSLRA